MAISDGRWTAIAPSQYPWEREALDFVRERLPDHEPYRAWSNFEFIADHGRIYEVDLLVVSPKVAFLVEIKSRPGTLAGDSHTWIPKARRLIGRRRRLVRRSLDGRPPGTRSGTDRYWNRGGTS